MGRFTYCAIEQATGRERRGTVDAASADVAIAQLKGRGLAPLEVLPERASAPAPAASPVVVAPRPRRLRPWRRRAGGLALFTRRLATLLRAGMPLLRSLEVLERQEREGDLRAVVSAAAERIRSGDPLSEALRRHPRVFDRLYVNMVRAGEAGGALVAVLERIAGFLEKSQRTRGRIKSAMAYPLVIVFVAAGIVAALMAFVVPKFEAIFAGTLKGQPLPALTRAVIGASDFVQHHGLVAAGLAVGVVLLGRIAARTPSGTRLLHRWQLAVPVWGDLARKSAIARFTRTLGTLLASGVPILEALRIGRDTAGNVHIGEAIALVHDGVKAGEGVARPLRGTGLFPDMVPSMIEVGEETGALPEMLARVADAYDEEVDHAINALTSLIEPLMIVIMATVVGTIVIALFLPIVRIIQTLG